MKSSKGFINIIIAVVAVAVLMGAGYYLINQKLNNKDQKTITSVPVIENISPTSGSVGWKITMSGSGLDANENDIAFTSPKINFQGMNTAYVNRVSSPDGKTLSFNLPDVLSACAYSRLNSNEACPDIGLSLPTGEVQISVVNKNGESNSVPFTVMLEVVPE